MKRTIATTWIPILRMLLVGILAQPAAATLFHDTAARYPLAASIVAAVEGAIIAYHSKSSSTEPAPDEYAELGKIFSEYLSGQRPVTPEFKTELQTVAGDHPVPAPPEPPKATG